METKQRFISQIQTSKSPVRTAEDVDDTALSYAEIKALTSGNPLIIEKMQLDAEVAKLRMQKAEHLSQRYDLEGKLSRTYPAKIAEIEADRHALEADMATAVAGTHPTEDGVIPMTVRGTLYTERKAAGMAILDICNKMTHPDAVPLGSYRGFDMDIGYDAFQREFYIVLNGKLAHRVPLGQDASGIITRLDHCIEGFERRVKDCTIRIEEVNRLIQSAEEEVAKPFPREAELTEKTEHLARINAALDMDRRGSEIVDGVDEPTEPGEDRDDQSSDERYDRSDRSDTDDR